MKDMLWRWGILGVYFTLGAIGFTYWCNLENAWGVMTIIGCVISWLLGLFFLGGTVLYHISKQIRDWLTKLKEEIERLKREKS